MLNEGLLTTPKNTIENRNTVLKILAEVVNTDKSNCSPYTEKDKGLWAEELMMSFI